MWIETQLVWQCWADRNPHTALQTTNDSEHPKLTSASCFHSLSTDVWLIVWFSNSCLCLILELFVLCRVCLFGHAPGWTCADLHHIPHTLFIRTEEQSYDGNILTCSPASLHGCARDSRLKALSWDGEADVTHDSLLKKK